MQRERKDGVLGKKEKIPRLNLQMKKGETSTKGNEAEEAKKVMKRRNDCNNASYHYFLF